MAESDKVEEERILRDMPWHVAGLLSGQRRAEIDSAVAQSDTLQDALEQEVALSKAVKAGAREFEFDTKQGWQKLSARLAAVEAPEQEPMAQSGDTRSNALFHSVQKAWNFISNAVSGFSPAPAFAAGAAAAVAVMVGMQAVYINDASQDASYQTLSASTLPSQNTQSYVVVFKPDVTPQDILTYTETTELTLTGVEPALNAFIFSLPTSPDKVTTFPNREDLVEFYAEIR